MEKSTAAENVQAAYVPVESDFRLKNNAEEIGIDSNFAAQSFWKDVLLRFVRKTSAIVGLILIILITIMAAIGPGMNGYTYSGQNLNEKNCAPRVKALRNLVFSMETKISIPQKEPKPLTITKKKALPMFITGSEATT